MQEQSLYTYIWLGTCIRYLIDAHGQGDVLHDFDDPDSGRVLFNLESLYESLVRHNLPVTQTHYEINGLYHLAREMRQRVDEQPPGTTGKLKMSKAEGERLRKLALSLRETLDAEATNSVAYVAHDRRHTSKTLLGGMATLLADGAFEDLPDVAQYDICEAGRAIVFDLPTAAGFHLMRATEAALRQYYERLIKRNRLAKPMWGPMLDALRNKKQKPPPSHLLDHLDTIRKNFRNPTQHPEKVYNLEETQDLLGLAADAISRMYRDAEDRGLT